MDIELKNGLFRQVTPHIHRLELNWWGFSVCVWLVECADEWVLIDTGPPGFEGDIIAAVESLLATPPQTILITHGHVDHIGGLKALSDRWNPQLWAHGLEIPFITGEAQYGQVESSDWGYRMLSRVIPSPSADVTNIGELHQEDKSYGLEVIHVPGHSPGMVALLHQSDRALIAADTFRFKLFGSMPLYTYDRVLARRSMRKLAAYDFDHLLPSHGRAVMNNGRELARSAVE